MSGLFIREIPFLALLVFWATYAVIELQRCRVDILTSVVPIGLFIIVYLWVRLKQKEKSGRG